MALDKIVAGIISVFAISSIIILHAKKIQFDKNYTVNRHATLWAIITPGLYFSKKRVGIRKIAMLLLANIFLFLLLQFFPVYFSALLLGMVLYIPYRLVKNRFKKISAKMDAEFANIMSDIPQYEQNDDARKSIKLNKAIVKECTIIIMAAIVWCYLPTTPAIIVLILINFYIKYENELSNVGLVDTLKNMPPYINNMDITANIALIFLVFLLLAHFVPVMPVQTVYIVITTIALVVFQALTHYQKEKEHYTIRPSIGNTGSLKASEVAHLNQGTSNISELTEEEENIHPHDPNKI